MIERIIAYSIRNRFLVLFAAGVLTLLSIYAALHTPMDAIPDLSENQIIVFTDWMGRSPQEVEDQVTYPLALKLQGLAGVREVRSTSEFNYSMIALIFEDNVDFYFARERVLERLTLAASFLPQGAVAYLAPDATALGQVFWYTVEGGDLDAGEMWALQRYYIGPELNSVPGVAEVGMAGGLPREYQIDVDPNSLRAYGVTLGELYDAVAKSNAAVGGRVIQKGNAEFLVRSVGWVQNVRDIENTVVKERNGVPIYIKNVATVQVGPGFRRSSFEKDGNEVVGGVVVMRHGENPLAVIDGVKKKIHDLQPGLPPGVRIVPAYDRSQLIHGAIDSLTEVMWHEMAIACLAILLILMHLRSALVICVTLPLSILFSFGVMWILRRAGIMDVQANIMSLAGITISIGILVDQAIVMVENATHHLKEHFGDRKVAGNTKEIVLAACRTVGRPIFFSVMIILLSFIPVFALSGREGKLFHPMAITKSLAMIGVAIISVTVVPALLPTFIKGKLKREEESWIVRGLIEIYRPVLNWALERRTFVMWAFAALLIVAAGMFPLQALLGLGAARHYWEIAYFATVAVVLGVVVVIFIIDFGKGAYALVRRPTSAAFGRLMNGLAIKALALLTLAILSRIAHGFEPKIGQDFMPPLDEGTLMYMPTTVARAGITQVADDLKVQDALLRNFPEVESVIGKAGRADTPTDPAPLDMVETYINFRPRDIWPKRVVKVTDALRQVGRVLEALEDRGYVRHVQNEKDRADLINDVAMNVIAKFDDAMRVLALVRYQEFEKELGPTLVRFGVEEIVRRFEQAGDVRWPDEVARLQTIDRLTRELTPRLGVWLAKNPALEDVTRLSQLVARDLSQREVLLVDPVQATALKASWWQALWNDFTEILVGERKTFAGAVLQALSRHRLELWHHRVHDQINWELFDRAVETFTWMTLTELGTQAQRRGLAEGSARGHELGEFARAIASRRSEGGSRDMIAAFQKLREDLQKPFADGLILWPRKGGVGGDLRQEMDTVVQIPGWQNLFTRPIANRIDMLATGVRTPVGVKVFGPDAQTIFEAAQRVKNAIAGVRGAQDVAAEQSFNEGYLEIKVNREKAARYGISVNDIQDTIEVALGGRVLTWTVEGRQRFPVRVRYARDFREDEEKVKRLLVSGMASRRMKGNLDTTMLQPGPGHIAAPGHAPEEPGPLQVPLSDVADVRIVEGPTMIKSENGRLLTYVTMNVSGDRDMVGFVEEAQRTVADKVTLPEGVHLVWSGEFEHQVRAAKTLRIVFPAVIFVIFVVLYLTYKDFMDALLMMMAVPEALAGGVFFQFLFPKIMHGWDTPPLSFTVPVWIGYIAAFGMATETGIIMLVYLREAIARRGGLENIKSLAELRQAVIDGAVHRLRPKLLTEGVAIIALAPMIFSHGVGSEIYSAMALPVLGGLLIADEVVDIFLPVRFYWVRRARWLKMQRERAAQVESAAV
jgi:Cu(I)/Ag(I) efflux system membrane protein CusA/SilA